MNVQWVGSPNHYNGRGGYSITHITLHIMVGYLAGTDSMFASPDSQVSAHYGIGGDGTIHQYVAETDGSYSDANYMSNNSTISIEHEGGLPNVACTRECMDASAELCADIARRQGWDHLWHDGLAGNVWLHREIPGTDHASCPDLAPNGLDVGYVINKANQILAGQPAGEDDMQAIVQINDDPGLSYFDGTRLHKLTHPDQVTALQMVAQACGKTLPAIKVGSSQAPWGTRLEEALQ